MPRQQVNVTVGDDPNDSTAVQVVFQGLGQSYPKSFFFDYSQFDIPHVVQNMAFRKQLDNLGHIASDGFQKGINGNGGIECTDGTRYLVNVLPLSDGTYNAQFGKTVDAPDFGCILNVGDLDAMTAPAPIDHIVKNIKCFVRVSGFTQMNATAYAAINSRQFWS